MTLKLWAPVFLACLVLAAGTASVFAGDSVYGKVTRVKAGNLVTLDYGPGEIVPLGEIVHNYRYTAAR